MSSEMWFVQYFELCYVEYLVVCPKIAVNTKEKYCIDF